MSDSGATPTGDEHHRLGDESFMSAADLRGYMDKVAMAKMNEAVEAMDRARHAKDELAKTLSQPLDLTPKKLEEITESLLIKLRAAAERGETEIMVMRFPNTLCSDHGRAVNNAEASWPNALALSEKARDPCPTAVVPAWVAWASSPMAVDAAPLAAPPHCRAVAVSWQLMSSAAAGRIIKTAQSAVAADPYVVESRRRICNSRIRRVTRPAAHTQNRRSMVNAALTFRYIHIAARAAGNARASGAVSPAMRFASRRCCPSRCKARKQNSPQSRLTGNRRAIPLG